MPVPAAGPQAPAFATVKEACAAPVEFETQNVALYDRLLAAEPLPEDVKGVFDHNRVASLDRHKPAFERCAGLATAHGAAGHPAGRGAGGGGGRGHERGHCGHGHGGGPCGGHDQGREGFGKS